MNEDTDVTCDYSYMMFMNCFGSELCESFEDAITYANEIIFMMYVVTEKPDYSKYN